MSNDHFSTSHNFYFQKRLKHPREYSGQGGDKKTKTLGDAKRLGRPPERSETERKTILFKMTFRGF
jgi:hypothetical protein